MPRNAVLGRMLSVGLLFGSLVYAQTGMPAHNVSGKKHPNLAAAQRLCDQAFEKIQAAQSANEFDLGGHAAKAKDLLEQASKELKQAAMSSNKEHQ
ncbi:MAG: hypothetical protein WB711_04215 [Terriglobales bacterium]